MSEAGWILSPTWGESENVMFCEPKYKTMDFVILPFYWWLECDKINVYMNGEWGTHERYN